MVQFNKELPRDSASQKTTAAPKETVSTSEWTTPVHITGSDAPVPVSVTNQKDMQDVRVMNAVTASVTFPNEQAIRFNGTQPTSVANFPSNQKVTVTGGSTLYGVVQSVVTAGTAVQLHHVPCREVTVIARKGNSGSIYIGGSNVSSTMFGVELYANESFTFTLENADLIYINASVSGEGVSYVAI